MITVTRERAHADRMSHVYRAGTGYVAVGRPMMPPQAARAAPACEPLAVAGEGSLHCLLPPNNGPAQQLRWHPVQREWSSPVPGRGNRCGWTSAYLAAHGWVYEGPVPVE